jgi:hypothetical protein
VPSPLEPVSGAAQPNRKCEKVWTHPEAARYATDRASAPALYHGQVVT